MKINILAAWLLGSAVIVMSAGKAKAQIPADCHAIIATLEHNPRQVKLWSQIGRCGNEGAVALATAVRANSEVSDPAFWSDLGQIAYGVHHPALLQAALDVASDAGATFPARALGLQIALWHHNRNAGFANNGHLLTLRSILAGGVGASPSERFCVAPGIGASSPLISASLPADADQQIAATAERVEGSAGSAPALQTMARCLREELAREVPRSVDAAKISIQYVCDNVFRITNRLSSGVTLTYRVSGSEESDIVVATPGATLFRTEDAGSVSLLQGDRSIASASNAQIPCVK
jgi:hypothetical protein